MSAWLTTRNSVLSTFNAVNINYSTLSGTASNTITTRQMNYSTLVGSTISTNTIGGNAMTTGTLVTTGNVGIGTTTVNAPLQFANTTANRKISLYDSNNNDHQYFGFGVNANILRYQVDATNANHVFYAAASTTTSNELMRISGNGNVGIGTANPGYKLSIYGANNAPIEGPHIAYYTAGNSNPIFQQLNYSSDNISMLFDQYYDGQFRASVNSTVSYQIYKNGGKLNFNYAIGTTAGLLVNNVTAMTINSSGNVGIGRTNPDYPLDVYGGTRLMSNVTNTSVSATTNSLNIVRYNAPGSWSPNGGMIMFSNTYASNATNIIATGGISGIQTTNGSFGGGLQFWYASGNDLSVGMTMNSSGNVGIGTVSPTATLHVNGNIKGSLLTINEISATDVSSNWAPTNVTPGYVNLIFARGWPGKNADAIVFNTYLDGTGGNPNMLLLNKNGIGMRIYQQTFGSASSFYSGSYADVVLQNSSGNVGIGITNPSSILHVNGTTTFGNVNATSNSNTNAGTITAPASSGQAYGSTATNYYGTKLHIYGGNLSVSVWDNSNYGGDIVLAAGDVISYENNGTVGGSYVGGNAVIRSGRVAVNNVAGNTQTVIPGSIFFQIGSGSRNTSSSLGDYNTAMTIASSGNVGIGTVNPSSILHLFAASNTITAEWATNRANGNEYVSAGIDSFFLTRDATQNLGGFIRILDINTNGSFPTAVRGGAISFGTINGGTGFGGNPAVERMRITPDGNVGIGTNGPSQPLEIYKNNGVGTVTQMNITSMAGGGTTTNQSVLNLKIQGAGGGTVDNTIIGQYNGSGAGTYALSFNPGSTNAMNVLGSGNVGIGTTTPLSNIDPAGIGLDIQGSTAFDAKTILRILNPASTFGRCQFHIIGRYEAFNDGWTRLTPRTAILFGYQTVLNSAITYTNTIQSFAGHLGFFSSGYSDGLPAMTINSSGNVGIGTVSPSSKLDVAGAINCTSFLVNGIAVATGTGSVWGVNGSSAYYTSGNVGIGTINPTGTLQIASLYTTSGIWSGPTLNFQFNAGDGRYWMAGAIVGYVASNAGGTAGYPGGLAFQTKNPDNVIETVPTTKMVIDSNGNVGIGTATPTNPLDVRSNTGNTGISFRNTLNGSTGDIFITHSTAAGNFIINGTNNAGMILSNGDLYLNRTSALNAALMVQKDTGNVGIGITNPNSILTVNGTIEIIGGGKIYPYANALIIAGSSATGLAFQVPGNNMGTWTPSNFTINTGLSVAGTKSFCIPHPVKEKRDNGHVLYHCSLETPNNGDTLQRFQITTTNLAYTIVMPDYYYNLCKNIMVSISSVDTFGQSKYNIVSDAVTETVTININVSQDGMYNVFIYGERKDAEIQKSKFQVEKHEPHKIQEIKKNCAPDRPCMYCDSCTNALSNS